ncbi:hypothetical protein [Pseudomonas folii]|uniref:Beta/Gamma crystallin n=1 Tax=Pseudomonas folii TaxID=2762593 RepID=A0ABR7B5T1_9PSED|nr:hypothetical protein [Pseudomonas folii]MBC3952522.1 hypothetical protein [Pseudomonas folii]
MHTAKLFYLGLVMTVLPILASTSANAADAGTEKVEECVQSLRTSPSETAGHIEFEGESFSQIWISGKERSAAFNSCLDSAGAQSTPVILFETNDFMSGRDDDFQGFDLKNTDGVRYLFSDSYQRKYLLDIVEKRSYELLRIPPSGSIEASGRWDGPQESTSGCRNSYNDPCGTQYKKNAAGGYDKK